jgi:hypothetical protein
MFFVNLIAAYFVARWALKQILGMMLGLALVVLAALGGDPWPALIVAVIFLVCWGLAAILWRLLGFNKPMPVQPSLEQLCATERRLMAEADGFSFSDSRGLHADARARW